MPSNEYRVKSGDTLSAIARRNNVSMDVLARLNGLSDINRLYVGQVLKLPEPATSQESAATEPQTYRVRAGETLGDIATRFGITVEELCKANGTTELTTLVVGQVLTLPKKTPEPDKKTPQEQGKNTSTQGTKPTTNEVMAVSFRITGAFEGGTAKSYQNQDSGIVSYGKHQATLASGTLGLILQKYVAQSSSVTAKQMSAYMDRVNKKDAKLRDDAGFKKLLLAAADEPVMGTIQDAVFAENYWPAAEKGAKEDKLQTPLALAMYYDTNIQGGLSAVRKSTAAAMKGKEFTEAAWLKEFNQQRDQRLKKLAEGRREAAKDKTKTADEKKSLERDAAWIEGSRVRVTDLQKLVTAGDFQLQGDNEGKLLINGKKVDGLKGGGGKSGGNPTTTTPSKTTTVAEVVKPGVTLKQSANYGSRGSTDIDAIIVHHTASNNAEQDLVQLTKKGTGVSAHYLLAPDGTIYQLVDDDKRAWHAGVSAIRGEKTPDVNSRSIGIEITNDGLGKTPFTEEQYQALEKLVPYLAVTYEIPMENILGHRDVAPGRKTDPADNFDWPRVRAAVDAARGSGGGTKTTDSKPKENESKPKEKDVIASVGAGVIASEAPAEVWSLLEKREGKLEDHQKVYDDGRGFLTAGLGHKLTTSELGRYKEGEKVPVSVLKDWAKADIKKAYDAAVAQATQAGVGNQAFVNALTSVNFQLGTAWNQEHKKTWGYIKAHQWDKAATEAADSKWNTQTPVRVQDFQAALRALNGVRVQPVSGSGKTGTKTDATKTKTTEKTSTQKTSTTGGSNKPAQGPDIRDIVRKVHDAMAGAGTDEEAVYTNLAKLKHDASLISQFKSLYKSTYHVDVVDDIKGDFSNTWLGNDLDRALSYLHPSGNTESNGSSGNSKTEKDKGGSVDTKNATLVKLATGKLKPGGDGMCVTVVRDNMTTLGIPTYGTTGNDPNNSRGAMVQLLLTGKWVSLQFAGSELRTIESKTSGGKKAYGNADAYVCPGRDVLKAAADGKVPEGALIFQTMHGWDYSGGASGNDVGIVRKVGDALTTFNYKQMSGLLVHESAKKKRNITKDDEVVILVPKDAVVKK